MLPLHSPAALIEFHILLETVPENTAPCVQLVLPRHTVHLQHTCMLHLQVTSMSYV
jgi:hypothetical protein